MTRILIPGMMMAFGVTVSLGFQGNSASGWTALAGVALLLTGQIADLVRPPRRP